MKILICFLILSSSSLLFSQNQKNFGELPERPVKKFEVQLDGGFHLADGNAKYYGAEVSLNYKVSSSILAGAGFLLFPKYSYDFYSPYGQITFKSSTAKIAPYGKIACGANFSSVAESWAGVYFAIGAGAEYKLTDKIGITAELTHKSFSFHKEYMAQAHYPNGEIIDLGLTSSRPYFSYLAPYIGVNMKF